MSKHQKLLERFLRFPKEEIESKNNNDDEQHFEV